MVPTVDTIRYDFIVSALILKGIPVLLVGPVGTGKTSVAQNVLDKLDPAKFSMLTINMSSQVSDFCNCLMSHRKDQIWIILAVLGHVEAYKE